MQRGFVDDSWATCLFSAVESIAHYVDAPRSSSVAAVTVILATDAGSAAETLITDILRHEIL